MKKSISSLLLAAVMAFSVSAAALTVQARAESQTFSDVPSSHWAYADIEALAAGKLVNGMGDGTFAPDAELTIAQMATIIANAKGTQVSTKDGKWYYGAVKTAVDGGYLPDFGAITGGAYEETCSRELAVYMVVEGLGVKATAKNNGKTVEDIPDYAQITRDYRQQVLKAVQFGIINGIDAAGTFAPQNPLTRAQICAILNRAGYTTAVERAEKVEGLSNQDIYNAVKATGLFEESTSKVPITGQTQYILTANDRKYARLQVGYDASVDTLFIEAKEYIKDLVYDADYNVLDESGKIYSTAAEDAFYDDNGKYMPASGLSYSSRQLLQQVLRIAFPNDADKAIDAIKAVMVPPHVFENSSGPRAIRWLDGHAVNFQMGTAIGSGYGVAIYSLNDTAQYDSMQSGSAATATKGYSFNMAGDTNYKGSYKGPIAAYELDKW